MKQQRRFALIGTGVIIALLALTASAQNAVEIEYTWTAPTGGSPVDHYVVEHSVNGGAFAQIGTTPTNSYILQATPGDTHQIRVAGVDALGRQGPLSEASEPYTPELGPPGQPGQPVPVF
jgi:hypothetical protein